MKHQGHQWINCFPKPSTSLECLNFSCLTGEVNAIALEELVARSPNLKSLRLNPSVPIDVLPRILSRTPMLEDLGTGSFVLGNNAGAYISLYRALGKCTLLKSLSGFWDASGLYVQGILLPICKISALTCLNLSYAPLIQSDQLISIVRLCTRLHVLWVKFTCSVARKFRLTYYIELAYFPVQISG